MILRQLERDKIDYGLPTFTLDVNQLALRKWPPGLPELEWNYMVIGNLELCVTPETAIEITKNAPLTSLGPDAYDRFQKSQLFKSRPPGTTLSLTSEESSTLWGGIRGVLFPTTSDSQMTSKHRSDVTQVFFHTVASGSLVSSAFITDDNDIYRNRNELRNALGITVLHASEAWEDFRPRYNLYVPKASEIQHLISEQKTLLKRLREG